MGTTACGGLQTENRTGQTAYARGTHQARTHCGQPHGHQGPGPSGRKAGGGPEVESRRALTFVQSPCGHAGSYSYGGYDPYGGYDSYGGNDYSACPGIETDEPHETHDAREERQIEAVCCVAYVALRFALLDAPPPCQKTASRPYPPYHHSKASLEVPSGRPCV